jgi:ribokinase
MGDPYDIVVVGSLNEDLVARVPRIPAPGETVLATGHSTFAGGKGANQATAAARLGARVAMVGRVGGDDFGHRLAAGLEADGIDTQFVTVDETVGSGLALINVDESGENAITVSPGANGRVGVADVAGAGSVIAAASILLLQLEVPVAALLAAVAAARGIVILNPAPAAVLPAQLLSAVDILVPNETELALLSAQPAATDEQVVTAAGSLPIDDVVVTMGASGAMLVRRSGATHVAAPSVTAVDTTGAGDAFCGALAAEMARGAYLEAAVRFAVRAAAVAVTRHGAQAAMPTRDEVA